MTIQEIIQSYGIEYLGRFYSTYRAIVTDNIDPDNMGQLYISIPSIHDGLETWALPKHQDGGLNYGMRGMVPKLGQIVYVEFESGDPMRALWSYHGWATKEMPKEFTNNEVFGFITPGGIKVLVDEKENTISIDAPKGLTILSETGINLLEGKVGIPESNKVLTQINNIEEKLNTLMNAIRNAETIPQDGGFALQTFIKENIGDNLITTTLEDLSSEKIKQPN